jgi:hypothetical protein
MSERRPLEENGTGTVVCANCQRGLRPDEWVDDEWRAYADASGEPHLYCPECIRREFAPDSPASGRVPLVEHDVAAP